MQAYSVQANKVQLSSTVASQVEAARTGMSLLDKAHKTLANMQHSYKVWCFRSWCCYGKGQWLILMSANVLQMIDQLCTECSALIENHEKIQVLSAVHYNLGKTLQVTVNRNSTQALWLCECQIWVP